MSVMSKDEDRMQFGKYRGEKLGDVPETYFVWLMDQTWFGADSHPGLYEYAEALVNARNKEKSR